MDTILAYIKENILAIIAILISLYALYQNSKSDKTKIKRDIAKKKAQLKALESHNMFFDSTSAGNAFIRKSELASEIHELEKML